MSNFEQDDVFAEDDSESIEDFEAALDGAAHVYIKKLSLNDWQWSENPQAHQGGLYVPQNDRDSGFFPSLVQKDRADGGMPILEAWFDVTWPQGGGEIKKARLVHYTSKGEETHLTNVVKEPFRGINPASLLLLAKRLSTTGDATYTAMVADSVSAAAEYLRDLFNLSSDFRSGVFQPEVIAQESKNRALTFLEQALAAWKKNDLVAFSKDLAHLPSPVELAQMAQQQYLTEYKLSSLNPFELEAPGDSLMKISRDIEFRLFKEYQLQNRSIELIKIILGLDSKKMTIERALRSIVDSFSLIDKVLLSAAQQRKSRAGRSFELHIERLLTDGAIPHEVQVVIETKKRPDFVLPNYKLYRDQGRSSKEALVLSAKTTLRERWKQVHAEIRNCDLYLATVDDNVTESAIDDMMESGIYLVVPESLKNSDTTVYRKKSNVLSFKDFFGTEIRKNRLPLWTGK